MIMEVKENIVDTLPAVQCAEEGKMKRGRPRKEEVQRKKDTKITLASVPVSGAVMKKARLIAAVSGMSNRDLLSELLAEGVERRWNECRESIGKLLEM